MTNQQTTTDSNPYGHVIAFTAFGRGWWLQLAANGVGPEWPHPQDRRWTTRFDGWNTTIWAGRIFISTATIAPPPGWKAA